MKIIINPGHAPNTPGKCSPDKTLKEWEWNLATAEIVVKQLRDAGYDVEMARAMDEKASLTGPVSVANNWCKKLGAKNVLFISIHCNAAGNGREWMNARGWSIWTTVGQTESDKLASCIFHGAEKNFVNQKLRKDIQDGDVDYESNFYVLRKTACPAVLIEHFFMDNHEDCEFLKTETSKVLSARAILDGLNEYLGK